MARKFLTNQSGMFPAYSTQCAHCGLGMNAGPNVGLVLCSGCVKKGMRVAPGPSVDGQVVQVVEHVEKDGSIQVRDGRG